LTTRYRRWRGIPYGEVARVMDGLKGSGADPIGLQLDDLN
jgi:biopolymer transport protein ExbD